ncbi:DUF6364 family protein [Pseudomonadota bacterium]
MKNITLSVDENVLKAVRIYAAERHTSVNGLVRNYLKTLAQQEDRAGAARNRILELSRKSKARAGLKPWTRGELHEG